MPSVLRCICSWMRGSAEQGPDPLPWGEHTSPWEEPRRSVLTSFRHSVLHRHLGLDSSMAFGSAISSGARTGSGSNSHAQQGEYLHRPRPSTGTATCTVLTLVEGCGRKHGVFLSMCVIVCVLVCGVTTHRYNCIASGLRVTTVIMRMAICVTLVCAYGRGQCACVCVSRNPRRALLPPRPHPQ